MTGHIPFFFFFWGPALAVLIGFWLWRRTRALGVKPGLGTDIDGYSVKDVGEILAHYGPEGRGNWRSKVLPADTAFAAFYGLVGFGIALGLVERGQGWLIALACGGGWMAAAVADIIENLSFARMADSYPSLDASNVARASACTTIKYWAFIAGIIGILAAFYLARPTAEPLLNALFSLQ
ncbi:MAG: hypothetical protein ACRCWO_00580 [Bosea sp. (in: a-proteobacteria)]